MIVVAEQAAEQGYSGRTIYPDEMAGDQTPDPSVSQAALRAAFNDGHLLVHFLGHGGRYVWRTAPPDYRGGSDLFSLDDIASLSPGHPLPMVLSMTCSSGPFDHPSADSIAEAFLQQPDRGAVAVLAASWRIPASERFSAALVKQLTQPGTTIGEAVLRAKQQEPNRALVESYNLLGDPALVLAGQAAQTSPESSDAPQRPRPNAIRWATASEKDNFGYDIYRGLSEDGPFTRVNEQTIAGAGTTDVPQRYEYLDADIQWDTVYWYYVESISLNGDRKRITPVYASEPRQR